MHMITQKTLSVCRKLRYLSRKHSDKLLVATSIGFSTLSVIEAVRATRGLGPKIEDDKTNIHNLKLEVEKYKNINDKSNLKKTKNDLRKAYLKLSGKVLKTYAPTILLESISIGSTLGAHAIMTSRQKALASAYTTLATGYAGYRSRVRERFGEKVEQEIFDNVKKKTVTTVDEKGNVVTKEVETIGRQNGDDQGDYCYILTEHNRCFMSNTGNYLDFLKILERDLNDRLHQWPYHLFMEDVWEVLGVDKSQLTRRQLQESKVVGWIFDPRNPYLENRVSFGLFTENGDLNERAKRILKSESPDILVELNPDGDIVSGGYNKTLKRNNPTFMDVINCKK